MFISAGFSDPPLSRGPALWASKGEGKLQLDESFVSAVVIQIRRTKHCKSS